MIQEGGQEGVKVAVEVITSFTSGTFPEALISAPGTESYRSAWEETIDAAEDANEPGEFTAFIGYEWTSTTAGYNLHRVVIYRDGAAKASVMEPYVTMKPWGSDNPVELWKWLQSYEDKTGGQILAIAHNGNLSNGIMFPLVDSFTNKRVTKDYVETRARWEPLYETTQIKGDGETHPFLSPDDEFADYETWDQGNLDLSALKEDDMLQYEYARSALGIGMQLEERYGTNPYKFGQIGSTDSHTGLTTAEEENFFGKHSGSEPGPERYAHPMAKVGDLEYAGWSMVASGYAAVWATENTREAIFDAMMRKETYATTGPRMLVRFFGGWEFTEEDARNRLPANVGYTKGVPMGGDLPAGPEGAAPTFLVAALKDPYSGNLDRVQIVKVWIEGKERKEKVYDAVWSGDRAPGSDGKLPQVGNTVDVANATWTNTIGAPELLGGLDGPGFRSGTTRVLLCARHRDPDAALDSLRVADLQRDDAGRGADDHAGTRVYVADLVYAQNSLTDSSKWGVPLLGAAWFAARYRCVCRGRRLGTLRRRSGRLALFVADADQPRQCRRTRARVVLPDR